MGILRSFYRRRLNVEWESVKLSEKNTLVPFYERSQGIEVRNSYYAPPKRIVRHLRQQSTCLIIWEITLRKVRRQPDRLYKLIFRLYNKSEMKLLDEDCRDLFIRSNEVYPRVVKAWGHEYKANWQPGDYEVQLLLNGVDVVESCFTIGPAPPPPPPKPAAEVLHQPLVRFFPVGSETPVKETRQYNIRFPHQTTHKLFCELTVRNLLYQQSDRTYIVRVQCYTVDERLLWEDHHDWLIKSQEQEPMILWELQVPEGWRPGIYRVDILIDGLDFAWGTFAIEA
jgi:hypothetical protein